MAHSFNPKHSGVRGRGISELEANLVYRMSLRTDRATQKKPCLENKGFSVLFVCLSNYTGNKEKEIEKYPLR